MFPPWALGRSVVSMPWSESLSILRDVLAELYGEKEDIRRVVCDAGLDPSSISFNSKPNNLWHAILEEAEKNNLVPGLLEVAVHNYPKNRELLEAREAYMNRPSLGRPKTEQSPPPAPDSPEPPAVPLKSLPEPSIFPASKPPLHDLSWPGVGHRFLIELRSMTDPSRFPFKPERTTSQREIVDERSQPELAWHISDRLHLSVNLRGKRNDKVKLFWGFYSDNQRRDPLFRKICYDLLEGKEELTLEHYSYEFFSDGYLGLEASATMTLSSLADMNLARKISEQILLLSRKVWPVIEKSIESRNIERNWPAVGHAFLKSAYEAITPLLPFAERDAASEKEVLRVIREEQFVFWQVNKKSYFALCLGGKRLDSVTVHWGFYSEKTRNDPIFRKTINDLFEMKNLIKGVRLVVLGDASYHFDGDNLGLEASRRIDLARLADKRFLDELVRQLVELSTVLLPIIQANYGAE
jgi:hypothetical protein